MNEIATPNQILITRWEGATPFGTFGTLKLGAFTCFTLELPWKNNQRTISCIPEGKYLARLGTFKPDIELLGVPDRSAIEIHRANLASELRGCIAVGKELGMLRGEWAVLGSALALRQIVEREINPVHPIHIEIKREG